MSNPFEALWQTLKISVDITNEPKSPLHIIEAGDCWTYLTLMEEFICLTDVELANGIAFMLMRKRGWLKVPPYYYPPGGPPK